MALAASRTRIQQHGDAIIGEQTQLVYDQETGLVGQKKTTVAEVPTAGGGRAFVVAEQVQVGQVHAPQYAPRRTAGAITYPVNDTLSSEEKNDVYLRFWWLVCGCCVFLVGLAIIIPLAAVGLVSCVPLQGIATSGFILGAVTLIMSCLCCLQFCNKDNGILHCLCCSSVFILLLVFFGALISNTVFVAENINFIYNPDETGCSSPLVSVAVISMSWIMFLLLGAFCLCSAAMCVINCNWGHSND